MRIDEFKQKAIKNAISAKYKKFEFLDTQNIYWFAQFQYTKYKLYVSGPIKENLSAEDIIEEIREEIYNFTDSLSSNEVKMKTYIIEMLKNKYYKDMKSISAVEYWEWHDRMEDRLMHELRDKMFELEGFQEVYEYYEGDFDFNKFLNNAIEVARWR